MLEESKQLFASKYKLVLPTEEELRAELEREKQLIREHLDSGSEKKNEYRMALPRNKKSRLLTTFWIGQSGQHNG